MTLINDKRAVDCAMLGRNLVNLNLTPKRNCKSEHKILKTFEKINKNQYHEKCNHYYQNRRCPIMARVNDKTIHTGRHIYLTTMTVLLM